MTTTILRHLKINQSGEKKTKRQQRCFSFARVEGRIPSRRNNPASRVPAGMNYRARTTDRQLAMLHTKIWWQIPTHVLKTKE